MTILRFHCPLYSIRPNYIIKGQEFVVRLFDGSFFYSASTSVGQIGQSIYEFINTVNDLLRTVWTTYHNSHSSHGTAYSQPFINYDPVTDLFSLIFPPFFATSIYNIDLQVNPTLFYYIAGFAAKQLSDGFNSLLTNIELDSRGAIEDRYYFCKYYNNAVDNSPFPL
jgi:hypothetical protein